MANPSHHAVRGSRRSEDRVDLRMMTGRVGTRIVQTEGVVVTTPRPLRVLIAGAGGMLGRTLVRVLAEPPEILVTGAARRSGAAQIHLDAIGGYRAIAETLDVVGEVDVVVNAVGLLGSLISPDRPSSLRDARIVNTDFPQALAAVTDARGIRLVHVSTDGVFRGDADHCGEMADDWSDDVYGGSKRDGEPVTATAISVRSSFVGVDRVNRRGLLEWLRAQPPGASVPGYVNHRWNGLTTLELAEAVRHLLDERCFAAARQEGPVHHVARTEIVTKFDLLESLVEGFGLPVRIEPVEANEEAG